MNNQFETVGHDALLRFDAIDFKHRDSDD
jgi:hypothetical protein